MSEATCGAGIPDIASLIRATISLCFDRQTKTRCHRPARPGDPVFQRQRGWSREAAGYWMPRSSRGMTAEDGGHSLASPRHDTCPSCASASSLQQRRAQGVPDAGRTRRSCVPRNVHFTHASNVRAAGTTGTPRAMGYGLYVISSVRRASGHRRRAFVTRDLIPASGDRDRTISPSAPARSSAAP